MEFDVRPRSADKSFRDVSVSALNRVLTDKGLSMSLDFRSQGIETENPPQKMVHLPYDG